MEHSVIFSEAYNIGLGVCDNLEYLEVTGSRAAIQSLYCTKLKVLRLPTNSVVSDMFYNSTFESFDMINFSNVELLSGTSRGLFEKKMRN